MGRALARRLAGEERGMALVVALLVTLISFIVVSAILAQAVHNIAQSGYMRRRLSAVNAAEAGLNLYWKTLEKTSLLSLSSSPWSKNGAVWEYTGSDVASAPDAATFRLRVRYVKENPCVDPSTGAARTCSSAGLTEQLLTDDPFPATVYAIVRSIGCVGNTGDCWSTSSGSVRRALETVMRLRTRYGGISGSVTSSYVCLDQAGKLTMSGDLYVMGAPMTGPPGWPAECAAGVVVGSGDELTMTGSLFAAQGDLAVDDGGIMTVSGNIWARDRIMLGTGVSTATSCADSIVKMCVQGDATGSAVTIGSKALVVGEATVCNPACPPTILDFPQTVWDPADWSNWILHDNQTPAQALAALANPQDRSVYHVTGSNCVIDLSGTYTINVEFAIVGECRFELNSATKLLGTGTLLLVSPWPGNPGTPTALPSAACGGARKNTDQIGEGFDPGPRDIYMHNNPDTSGPNLFFYTPCSLKIDNNQNPVKGQLVARFLWIKNQANVALVSTSGGGQITLPGLVSGFSQDVRYINEIQVATALV